MLVGGYRHVWLSIGDRDVAVMSYWSRGFAWAFVVGQKVDEWIEYLPDPGRSPT